MTVENDDLFTSLGFTCNQSIKKGKSYDIQYSYACTLIVGKYLVIKPISPTQQSMRIQ